MPGRALKTALAVPMLALILHVPNASAEGQVANQQAAGTIDAKLAAYVYPGLDKDAERIVLETVKSWRFRPALDAKGRPVRARLTIEIHL